MTENKRQTGSFYEDRAAEYLESIGYDILCRNFYGKGGEIDIVAKDNETLVFVEVKYRSSVRYGFPEEAVTAFKNMFTGFTDYLLSSKYVNLKIIQLKIEKSYSYIDYNIK